MKILGFETNEIILKELGVRLKSRRIALDMTQKVLALESGVSQRTISGFENGENISLDNLVSLFRALRLLPSLDTLIPEKKINPFDMLEQGQSRQRASSKLYVQESAWEWGDES
mgnify:CR=1 FL=1